jgi:hypothetical protein
MKSGTNELTVAAVSLPGTKLNQKQTSESFIHSFIHSFMTYKLILLHLCSEPILRVFQLKNIIVQLDAMSCYSCTLYRNRGSCLLLVAFNLISSFTMQMETLPSLKYQYTSNRLESHRCENLISYVLHCVSCI